MKFPYIKFFKIALIFIIYCYQPLLAQQLPIRVYNVEDGLPQSEVQTIIQDDQGLLWIGTVDGLASFDGKKFTNYSRKDGLPSNQINTSYLDSKGNLWFAHKYSSVSRRIKSENRFESIQLPVKNKNVDVMDILEDPSGAIWFATFGAGVIRFDSTGWKIFSKKDGLHSDSTSSFCIVNQNELWISNYDMITIIDLNNPEQNQFEYINSEDGLPSDYIYQITEDEYGDIWVATNYHGVAKISIDKQNRNNKKIIFLSEKEGLGKVTVQTIYKDASGKMWLGTFENGVFEHIRSKESKNKHLFKVINKKNGLSYNSVTSIYQDKEGSFWFGTGYGLCQYRGRFFELFVTDYGLGENSVWVIHEDAKGDYWFGTEMGLYNYSPISKKIIKKYYGKNNIFNKECYEIYEDESGKFWLSIFGYSLCYYDPVTGSNTIIHKFDNYYITAILSDGNGNLLLSTFDDGLLKWKPGANHFKQFTVKDGLSSDLINDMLKTESGNIWLATEGGGLCSFRSGKFKKYNLGENLEVKTVLCLATDNSGNLWLGTEGFGLFKYDEDKFTQFTEKNGLSGNDIYSLVVDDKNNIWMGTQKGLEKLNIQTGKVKYYGYQEGFTAIENNQGAAFKDSKGNLWFGTIKGAVKYNPSEDKINMVDPVTSIEEVKVFSQKSSIPLNHEYSYKDNHLTFYFSGLSYIVPERIRYQYKLDGGDENWSPVTSEQYATYTNLQPGNYVFSVKASNSDGIWNSRPASFEFEILAPFWQTGWFFLLIAITISGSIYGLHKKNVYQIEQDNKKLETKVKERTLELVSEKEKVQSAYKALLESEEKYKTFVAYSSEAIWCIETLQPISTQISIEDQIDRFYNYGYLSECNDVMAQMYGYKNREEMLGVSLKEIFNREKEQNINSLRTFIKSGYRLTEVESYEIDKNGNRHIFINSLVGIIEDNKLVRAWRMQRDVTKRKLAEEALLESEERYRKLIELSPEAIIVHSNGKILYVNHSCISLFGAKKPGELTGGNLLELVHPDFHHIIKKRLQRVYENKDQTELLVSRMLRLDGTELEVEIVEAPIIYMGENAGQIVIRDVTEKNKLEEELARAQKLESIGVLAGGIAHDFNNILTAILGNISLAKMELGEDDKTFSTLESAENATTQAKKLTKQLLTFSQGGAPFKEASSIFEIVKESAGFTMRGSKTKCNYTKEPDLWTVEVDPGQMHQVIQNILLNADQAMPQGGKIDITLENYHYKKKSSIPLSAGKYVKITINDQGIGIKKEFLPKVFDPFFTTKQKGCGLGLATVYSIIKKHDGYIKIRSRQGQGTTIEIYLPASEKIFTSPKIEAKEDLHTGNGKILVMDDEKLIQNVAEQLLTHLGYQVTLVNNGDEAIREYLQAMSNNTTYSLIILDLTIPGGVGGKEALQEIKRYDPNVKAIVSSGYSNDPVMAHYKQYGFKSVLPKPYTLENVSKILVQTLEKN